jgi:valyl-tRNA synthetase
MKELEKAYEPKIFEDTIYKRWENSGFFNPDVCIKQGKTAADAPSFSIALPPPNVTGTLHMGHAAMLAIQDVMARYHRMKGDKTLWVPGTDHAAIATQTKVEKLLMEKGMKDPRGTLGREKFLGEIRKFAQESHDTIVSQCRKMGSSLDWSREAFTLDDMRSLAVRTVFRMMHEDGLIYRGYRIVNWCPHCHSTLADDEVLYKEQKAKLYTFKYGKDFPIFISTTRPETKLGDTAVAVNPKDKRYKKFIGRVFEIKKFAGGPDLTIKIIGDESVDMNFGTGALGVTPAHSHVDYDMAQKNKLEIIKIIGENGKITDKAAGYAGLDVPSARKKIVENLAGAGLMEKEEDVINNLSVCYRCGTPIEPLPSRQWFIDVNKKFVLKNSRLKGVKKGSRVTLKELMQKAVKSGQIEIIPDRFNKTYFHWIDDLRDWCISRQIWYGHRIPVWYRNDEIFVGEQAPGGEGWEQDADTLDTWFSSGLWTFSTLGWPNNTSDLKNYHPTSVMETGYDILFFWVARMILMTTYALGDIPFQKVYLHGLVRDEQGRKMSKSVGNVIDPLTMIAEYGTDATRLSLLIGNTPGNDMKLSEEKIAGFKNFTNKLWNISRFILLNIKELRINAPRPEPATLADLWILNKLDEITAKTAAGIESFNLSLAGENLRDFTWGDLADWYLEIAKIEGNKQEILNYILNTLLKLWHPFMPYVTEALWSQMYGPDALLMMEKFPVRARAGGTSFKKNLDGFDLLKNIVAGIRSARADYKIEPAKKLNAVIGGGSKTGMLKDNAEIIRRLARLENLQIEKTAGKPSGCAGLVFGDAEVFLDLSGVIDLNKEPERLKKEIVETKKYADGLSVKLKNKEFVRNAPAAVVEKEHNKLAEAMEKINKLKSQLSAIK